MSTLLITHPACLDHITPAGHPERPDRLRAIDRALGHERFRALVRVEAPAAALDTIALCHPMQYVTAIRGSTPTPRCRPGASKLRYARPAAPCTRSTK